MPKSILQNYLSNHDVLRAIVKRSPLENFNQFSLYLSEKYQTVITRQQLRQFEKKTTKTLTHLLLRELMEEQVVLSKKHLRLQKKYQSLLQFIHSLQILDDEEKSDALNFLNKNKKKE